MSLLMWYFGNKLKSRGWLEGAEVGVEKAKCYLRLYVYVNVSIHIKGEA
jgi:hypothetical protein